MTQIGQLFLKKLKGRNATYFPDIFPDIQDPHRFPKLIEIIFSLREIRSLKIIDHFVLI
ncbi:unnamed protein product [Meloidogyne enterolobii]|uniref:Uncharacterized protein n=1 Tax=Meloidogyne enterolobii TaxID=390850 RepID=A0ACB0ZUC3_MELEN